MQIRLKGSLPSSKRVILCRAMVEMEGRIFIYQKYVVFMSKCILQFDINYLFKDFRISQNYDFIDFDLNQLYYAARLLHYLETGF